MTYALSEFRCHDVCSKFHDDRLVLLTKIWEAVMWELLVGGGGGFIKCAAEMEPGGKI
jgi:hypothetical protein